ncbi:amino acid adenylation domain-containing protein [Streptomyces olivaceoviridis]|uniref:amino acid adenylation domain-containing protein n=1 Tax=Streptomyces olivaceoviridis TaxID=1921 RepID=UPI0036FDD095
MFSSGELLHLTRGQWGLWLEQRSGAPGEAYNIATCVEFDGRLDESTLAEALRVVVEEAQATRTRLSVRGDRVFQTVRAQGPCLSVTDLDTSPVDEAEATARAAMRADALAPVDLAVDSPVAFTLFRLAGTRDLLYVRSQHTALDGFGHGLVIRRLAAVYTALCAGTVVSAPTAVPLSQVVASDESYQKSPAFEADREYWRERLAGAAPPVSLSRESARTSPTAWHSEHALSAGMFSRLRARARRCGTGWQAGWVAAVCAYLHRLTGEQDIVVGLPTHGRTTEALLGTPAMLANVAPIRLHITHDTLFEDLIRQSAQRIREALRHQRFREEDMRRVIGRGGGDKLFGPVINMFTADVPISFAEHRARLRNLQVGPVEDLRFSLFHDSGVNGTWVEADGNAAGYSEQEVAGHLERLLAYTDTLTSGTGLSVGRGALLMPGEDERVLTRWNSSARELPGATLATLFEERVAAAPDAPALEHKDTCLTYGELDARSDDVARLLRDEGVLPGSVVAVALPRSTDLVVTLLAVVKCGAAYLPLDPALPAARVESVLKDVPTSLVISVPGGVEADGVFHLPDTVRTGNPAQPMACSVPPTAAAYLIHTSGSTGTPKGVLVPHEAITNQLRWLAEHFHVGHGDRLMWRTTVSFDAAAAEIWLALISGATLCVADESVAGDAGRIVDFMRDEEITVAQFVPSLLRAAFDAHGRGPGERLRQVMVAGEPFPADLARAVSGAWKTRVTNLYGPTETAVNVSVFDSAADSPSDVVPIGSPVWNTRMYVLDEALQPVPPGVPGELYVAGAQLAVGYHGRPGLTAERFVACPFADGERMYRTGDRVRWSTEGVLHFLGRTDDQVKIRGFRIEPGEVEHALTRHPDVAEAVVRPWRDPSGNRRLVAWVRPTRAPAAEGDSPHLRTSAGTGDAGPSGASQDDLRRVGRWRGLYESLYAPTSRPKALGTDFSGWTSRFGGVDIPLEEMEEWRGDTVERILRLNPRRVLEIGVGSGLILSHVGPHVTEYWGTDLSTEAVAALQASLLGSGLADRVRLTARPAHDLTGLPRGHFDVVVLNSVVQYFPSGRYLADVVRGCLDLLTVDGAVFVGDVRDLRLRHRLETAVARWSLGDHASESEVRHATQQALLTDEELSVHPDFFAALAERDGTPLAVTAEWKQTRRPNELNTYRYDVTLRRNPGEAAETADGPRLSWGSQVRDLAALGDRLTRPGAGRLRVDGIPNARLSASEAAVDPYALRLLAERHGYAVSCAVDAVDPERFHALLAPAAEGTPWPSYRHSGDLAHPAAYTSDPASAVRIKELGTELRAHLAQRLPDYMVPSAFVVLATIPLTANGKTDVRALPAPEASPGMTGRRPTGPREEIVSQLFATTLGVPAVGTEDDFFALGGDSLSGTKLISAVRAAFGEELTIRDLFDRPTPALLAAALSGTPTARPGLEAGPRPETIPMSFAQRRLWFLSHLDRDSGVAYNMPMAVRLRGPLDVEALRLALGDVVDRHESLRTVFPPPGQEPVQRVLAAGTRTVAVDVVRVDGEDLDEVLAGHAEWPFDLADDIPLRATLFRTAPGEHVLLVVLHHIAGDGWSLRPLADDLAGAYTARLAGGAPRWTPLPVQYADYALWQRAVLGTESDDGSLLARLLRHWRERLRDLPAQIPLPGTGDDGLDGRGDTVSLALGPDLHQRIRDVARDHQVTAFMVLQATVAAVLSRLGSGTDIPLGATVAGRLDGALDDLIGFFVNTLVLRTDTSGDPDFATLLDRVRRGSLDAYAHQEMPFDRLVEALNPDRSLKRHPLVQVVLSYHNNDAPRLALPGLVADVVPVRTTTAKFDLSFSFMENLGEDGRAAGIDVQLEYSLGRFSRGDVVDLGKHLVRGLEQATAHPGQRISRWEPATVTAEQPPAAGPSDLHETGVLPGLFEERVLAAGDAPAVTDGDRTLSYAELNTRANRLARLLLTRSAGPERFVAVLLPRSADLVATLLAVLKSGAAYLPIDPDYPEDRIAHMLAGADIVAIVTTSENVERLTCADGVPVVLLDDTATARKLAALPGHDVEDTERRTPLDARHPAYVIFTSGSTGRPKGVVVPHGNVVRLFTATWPEYRFDSADVWPLLHSYAFDVSVWEMWGALLHGGRLVVVPRTVTRSPQELLRLLADERVTVLNQTPTAFYQLMQADEQCPETGSTLSLRLVVFAGEALDLARLASWYERHDDSAPVLYNMYGTTETTVHANLRRLDAAGCRAERRSLIGAALPDLRLHVLDERLRPVAAGVTGELYLAGPGLARGYLGRPALTAERFVADPLGRPGERMYRTGDLARRSTDGELEYLGRADDQIKLRGFRIEPAEIEHALLADPTVAQAAAVVREDKPGDRRLVAYVTPSGPTAPDPVMLRARTGAVLPPYMVPSAVVVLDALPLTVHGKLDRRALPRPGRRNGAVEAEHRLSTRETQIARLFADVVGTAVPDADTGFFALGGDSILALQFVARAVQAGLDLTPRDVFEHQTVRALAQALTDRQSTTERRPAPPADVPVRPGTPATGADGLTRPAQALRETLDDRYGAARIQDVWPLSPLQEGMLFHHHYDREVPDPYGMQVVLRLEGGLDPGALRAAGQALLDRHSAWRAAFFEADDHAPVQVVLRSVGLPWEDIDLEALPAQERPGALSRWLARDRERRFDLTRPPLLRFTLLRENPGLHHLVISVHHILVDGWSLPLVLRELDALYRNGGDARSLPATPDFRDYLTWTVRQNQPGGTRPWQEALAGLARSTVLFPSAGYGAPRLPAVAVHELSAGQTRRVRERAREYGVTVSTFVQGAWALLLSRLTGQDDVVFGATVSGRPPHMTGVENMVGLLINTVPVRVRLEADETWAAYLVRMREEQTRLLDHHNVGLSEIQRATGARPLFDSVVVFENYPVGAPGERSAAPLRDGDTDGDADDGRPLRTVVRPGPKPEVLFERPRPATGHGGSPDDGISLPLAALQVHDSFHYPLRWVLIPGPRLVVQLQYRTDVVTRKAAEALVALMERLLTAALAPDASVDTMAPFSGADWDTARRTLGDMACPAPDSTELDVLRRLFARILGTAEVGADADFFALGGDSLRAAALVRRVRGTLRAELSVRDVFEARTPARLLRRVTGLRAR